MIFIVVIGLFVLWKLIYVLLITIT